MEHVAIVNALKYTAQLNLDIANRIIKEHNITEKIVIVMTKSGSGCTAIILSQSETHIRHYYNGPWEGIGEKIATFYGYFQDMIKGLVHHNVTREFVIDG